MQSWNQVQRTTISSTGSTTTSTWFLGQLIPANFRSRTKTTTASATTNLCHLILTVSVKQILITLTKVSNLYRSSTRKCNSDWDPRKGPLISMSSARTLIDSKRPSKRHKNGPKLTHHLRKFQMTWSQKPTTSKISMATISQALFVTKDNVAAATQPVSSRWSRADSSLSTETLCLSSPCNFCFSVIIWTKVARVDGLSLMGI